MYICKGNLVLVPFYRGAVVFSYVRYIGGSNPCSRPLLSRSGCISYQNYNDGNLRKKFSSPFIEERLYLRGVDMIPKFRAFEFSSPFIEERLYLDEKHDKDSVIYKFSSPFIEERLYLLKNNIITKKKFSVLVPFYRGAVVFTVLSESRVSTSGFSSPFIEERLYFFNSKCLTSNRRCPYSGRIERTAGHISSLPPSHISDGGSSAGAFQ